MDAVAGLLDGPRARGAFLLRSSMDPPWSLRIQDEAPLTLVAIVRGEAWVVPDGGEPVRLGRGDVAIVRGPGPYTVADDPA
ncbi:MAG: cupin domain-containing protein, partial [Solirubrobacteraceae bacterium]